MSAPPRLDGVEIDDPKNPYASDNRWRHQESSQYAKHAVQAPVPAPRGGSGSSDLSDFLNKSRIEPAPKSSGTNSNTSHQPIRIADYETHRSDELAGKHDGAAENNGDADKMNVLCGPLLNFRRMEKETWYGSVMTVVSGGSPHAESPVVPELRLRVVGVVKEAPKNISESEKTGEHNDHEGAVNGIDKQTNNTRESVGHAAPGETVTNGTVEGTGSEEITVKGTKLMSRSDFTAWRFDLEVKMKETELKIEYEIPHFNYEYTKGRETDKHFFFIPAISDSMRIMFHSCNGFSVGTDEEAWSGPALWNDVLRVHTEKPFHVMIGGGDQIYNDGIRVNGPLRPWTDIGNPHKRKEFHFPESLRRDCDKYYLDNYIKWYSTEPFASANGQIPQLNLWDDHDIIDGFGSYVDDFMKCPVFRGIGGVANKYYLLFQHHLAPPPSTYTTDAPQTTGHHEVGIDPRQTENTYVLDEKTIDSSYIIGHRPGPYVVEHSRSIYARLGARIAFFGIDARTERTRKQVNYPETYQIIFERLKKELSAARESSKPVQHLVVLLGIPIAYPRLTWLENIFTSPLIAPIKFLNKRFGFGGGFFNHFDGNIDLLDDLDDHYTARTHKKERHYLVQQLQTLAAEHSVRISILGGDVHLAAVGRFYSNPKLNIPIGEDHRYMANIISSAIVNKPPPSAVANLLAKRNKLHHLDHDTDETLMEFFDKDPGDSSKTSSSNKVTMPSRNWAMITENFSHAPHPATNGNAVNGQANGTEQAAVTNPKAKDGHDWLHSGEVDAGTKHKAANPLAHGDGTDGSLDIAIRVEKDQHDKEGKTTAYGMTIPRLDYGNAGDRHLRKRDAFHRHPKQ